MRQFGGNLRRRAYTLSRNRTLTIEQLESRQVMSGSPWQNPENRFDTNGDNIVDPFDLVIVLNWINSRPEGVPEPLPPRPSHQFFGYIDVNGDGWATMADVYDWAEFYSPGNTPPSLGNATFSTNINTPYTFSVAAFEFSDPWDYPPNNVKAIRINSLPTVGTLTNNGAPVAVGQFISVEELAAGTLTFTPVVGQSGSPYARFGIQPQDDGGTENGGHDFSERFVHGITMNVEGAPPGLPITLDVTGDYAITPNDAIEIINILNNSDSQGRTLQAAGALRQFDTNQDDFISAIDVVLVINYLNQMAANTATQPANLVLAESLDEGEADSFALLTFLSEQSLARKRRL